jgi:hypothetical protein
MPCFIISISDRDFSTKVLYNNPAVYRTYKDCRSYSFKSLIKWLLTGVYHGLIIIFITRMMVNNGYLFEVGSILSN